MLLSLKLEGITKEYWRNTQIYYLGLISVELRNFDVINRQGLLNVLKHSPEIGTI